MNNEKKIIKKTTTAPKKKAAVKSEGKTWNTLKGIWRYICMFKGVLISLPVLAVAIWEAFRNAARLPEEVGLNIQATGEYAMTVSRSAAVLFPLLLTLGCILLTCFSKRTLFPWLISIFTLVLPILIWITNIYPA